MASHAAAAGSASAVSAAAPLAAGQAGNASAAGLATAATVDVVFELATLLNTGLDRRTVQILMALIDAGIHPEALATVVNNLRSKASALRTG